MAMDFVAGCFGGCAGIIVGHPLDTIKVRIQTQDYKKPQYKGSFDCFKNIIKNESFLGLYKGVTSPLAGIAVINAIVFGVYGNLQRKFPDPDSIRSHFIAGTAAGLAQSFICSPVELAKTRMQIQQERSFASPLQCLRHIRETEGMKGVFRGLNVTLLREGWGFGIYFSTYEWLTGGGPVSAAHLLATGGTSGAASWLCTYPLDVVKSRIQSDGANAYKNSVDCLVKSLKSEGVSCLFRGLCPTLLRAFPTNAATWAIVTWIMGTAKTEKAPTEAESFLHDLAPSVSWHPCELYFNNFSLNYFADEWP